LIGDELRLGEHLPQYRELFDSWRANARKQVAGLTPRAAQDLLRATLHVQWPSGVTIFRMGEVLLLQRGGSGERVPARWVSGAADSLAVVVRSRGSNSALNWDETSKFRRDGFSMLLLDVYQTGAAAPKRSPNRSDHLVFHLSDDARRVQDILTGLASLGARAETGRTPGAISKG
jgi:hypothetical protein